jgi:hypothetical protein
MRRKGGRNQEEEEKEEIEEEKTLVSRNVRYSENHNSSKHNFPLIWI